MSQWVTPLTIVLSTWVLGKEALETATTAGLLRRTLSREQRDSLLTEDILPSENTMGGSG